MIMSINNSLSSKYPFGHYCTLYNEKHDQRGLKLGQLPPHDPHEIVCAAKKRVVVTRRHLSEFH